jgi:solute carrier family 38 (sodium-coupled neutral amino acid transporter), member 11
MTARVSYLMIVKDCFGHLFHIEDANVARKRALLVVISFFIMVPLSSQRDMANLSKTSRLSVIIDTLLVFAVAGNAPILNSLYDRYFRVDGDILGSDSVFLESNYTYNITAASTGAGDSLGTVDSNDYPTPFQLWIKFLQHDAFRVEWNTMFSGLGVLSFAFVCQHSAFIIAGSLENPTVARWTIVTKSSLCFCVSLALLCGITGYLGYFDDTSGNILNSLPIDSWSANTARTMLGVTMLFVYPMGTLLRRIPVENCSPQERSLSFVVH